MAEQLGVQVGVIPGDSTTWDRLRMGLQSKEAWEPAVELGDALPAASTVDYAIWGGLLGLGCILGAWALRGMVLRRMALRQWPALHLRLSGGALTAQATAELRALELLVGLRYPDSKKSTIAWQMLSPSEQVVAMGLMKHKSAHQLAEELSCTTSYIYNLRTSIRKKWRLEREESLHQALDQFHLSPSEEMD